MSDDNNTDLTLDEDFLLDDIADLPGFVTPPSGTYSCISDKGIEEKTFPNKEGVDVTYFTMNFKITDVHDINEHGLEEGEAPPKVGDIFSLMYKKDKQGVAFMKPLLTPVAEQFGVTRFSEIKEKITGLEYMMVLKRRWVKKVERHNLNVVKAAVV